MPPAEEDEGEDDGDEGADEDGVDGDEGRVLLGASTTPGREAAAALVFKSGAVEMSQGRDRREASDRQGDLQGDRQVSTRCPFSLGLHESDGWFNNEGSR